MKHPVARCLIKSHGQPPSGGCVLKPNIMAFRNQQFVAAAFGRLCVETKYALESHAGGVAAAFGRLCVETPYAALQLRPFAAAAFGRLCVETPLITTWQRCPVAAAFGRLCVETPHNRALPPTRRQPPSGGCVLKLRYRIRRRIQRTQPPSGGCVLKQYAVQPILIFRQGAAAFGRLCVETIPA